MPLTEVLKNTAAKLGFHVVRNYQNPNHTLMGLKQFDIRTVIDVGANSGQFARFIRGHLPSAAIHSFEPTPQAYEALLAWARQDGNVFPVQMALGEASGTIDINLHSDHSTSSSLLQTSEHCESLYPFTARQERISVPLGRLDDYVGALVLPLSAGILLKLDVQGFEAQVLRGAPLLLRRVDVCIAEVSLDVLYIGQSRFSDIFNIVGGAGLEYAGNLTQMYGDDGHVISFDAVFLRAQKLAQQSIA